MSKIFSFFSPSPPKPAPPPPPPPEPVPKKKNAAKRAQLIALKATGSAGLTDEANVGRRKILV